MPNVQMECHITDLEITEAVRNHLKGDHVRINVNLVHNQQTAEAAFFAKKIPTTNKSHRDYAEATRAFYKEIELYKSLFIDIDNAISPEREAEAKWKPIGLLTRDYNLLICEDLAPQGFYMLPERGLMPLKYIEMAIKVMAKMHAGSIIFEEKLNKKLCKTISKNFCPAKGNYTIGELYPNLIFESECTDQEGHPGYLFWEAGIRGQQTLIDHLQVYSTEEKAKIKERYAETVRQVYRMLEPSRKYRNVLVHADLWSNNLMFRDGPDGQVAQALVVDFQMARYAPPAHDLLSLLHINQDRPFREAHEARLMDLYYTSLAQQLQAEDLNISELLPREEFNESCVYYKKCAVLNQLICTQLGLTPPEICGKCIATSEEYNRIMYDDRSDILIESFHKDQFCKERATESIIEVVDLFKLL